MYLYQTYYNNFMVLWVVKMFALFLKKGGGDLNFCFIIPYLMTYHWKGLLSTKRMMLSQGFYSIPGWNGGLSKFNSCLTLIRCQFGQGWQRHMYITQLFFYNKPIKQSGPKNRLPVTNFQGLEIVIVCRKPFLSDTLFKMVR